MAKAIIEAAREDSGRKLEQVLARRLPGITAERARRLIEEGRVAIRGKVCKPGRKLWGNERIEVEVDAAEGEPPLTAEVPVLHQSRDLVVVDKPPGVVVEPDGHNPSLMQIAEKLGGFLVGGLPLPGIVHRLDKDTSGCVALARSDAGLAALKRAFEEGRVEKTYLALVLGQPPEAQRIETPYARDPANPRLFTGRVPSARRAALSFRRRERVGEGALLEVSLETGRTHQIRVQLSEAGFPVLGDAVYGGEAARAHPAAAALARQGLHAWRLRMKGGPEVEAEAPVPSDFEQALAVLRGRSPGG